MLSEIFTVTAIISRWDGSLFYSSFNIETKQRELNLKLRPFVAKTFSTRIVTVHLPQIYPTVVDSALTIGADLADMH